MSISSTNHSNIVFRCPLPGKPDPNVPWDPSFKEKRPRVPFLGQKDMNCGYYALKILLDERVIGKHPLPHQLEKRQIGVINSQHRKEISKIAQTIKLDVDLAKSMMSHRGSTTKNDIQNFLNNEAKRLPENFKQCINALKAFCKQNKYDDFLTYIQEEYIQAVTNSTKTLLRELKISEEEIQDPLLSIFKWEELDFIEKEWYQNTLVHAD